LFPVFFPILKRSRRMKFLIRLLVSCLFLALAFSGCQDKQQPFEAGSEGPSLAGAGAGLERAMEVQKQHTPRLMALPDVVGTATGIGAAGTPAVLVLTKVPGVAGIPGSLDGVPVVVKVTGEIIALPKPDKPDNPNKPGKPPKEVIDPTSRFDRPVPIGVSTGHPAITAGTIGARVKDNGGNVYALSNNHVYADENLANFGDKVLQPGAIDGGEAPADVIGTLYAYKQIKFDGSENVIDAAIALSSTDLLGNATPSDGYGTPKSVTTGAYLGQKVKKYGRTTGLTKGRVYAINATVDVGYDSGVARFVNQIVITPGPFSLGGDSGSLIVSDERGQNNRKPVGLLFAGSDLVTIANPIQAVLDTLGVTIDGE
jgi:hypothetical protein